MDAARYFETEDTHCHENCRYEVPQEAADTPPRTFTHLHAPARTCNTDLTELDLLDAGGHPEARGCSCRLGSFRQPLLCDDTVVQGKQSNDGLWDDAV